MAYGGVSPRAAYALLAFTSLCWGGNAVLGRLAVGEVSPVAVVFLRWLGVCLFLAPFAIRQISRDWAVLRPRLILILAMGSLGFAVFNVLFYSAAHYTTAINLGIVQGSMPVFILLGAFAFHRVPVTPLQGVGVVLTIFGVSFVAAAGDLTRLASLSLNPGDVIMIAACVLYSGYTVGLRNLPPVSSISLLGVLAGAALITSMPLAVAEFALGAFQWPSAKGWLTVLLIVLFPSLLAQLTYIAGVNALGPGRAGVFVNLIPVYASILAVICLGEPLYLYHVIALVLVLGGIFLSERFNPGSGMQVPGPKGPDVPPGEITARRDEE